MSDNNFLQSPEEIEKVCRKVFDEIDTDSSGNIDTNELKKALSKLAGDVNMPAPTDEEIAECLVEFDTNKDGVLNFTEFKDLVLMVLSD